MKILFLDIDGVLVLEKWGTPNWTKSCISALKQIYDEHPNLKIVISSTWRKKPNLIHAFMNMLEENEMRFDVIGMTSDIGLLQRDREVMKYLDDLASARLLLNVSDYVKNWAVLDDAPEFFGNNIISEDRLLFVSRHQGLTDYMALKVIKHFKGE